MAFDYEIKEHIAVLGEHGERQVEVNVISWNGRQPKVDIRRWSEDHTFMGKGVALTEEEAEALYRALKERYEA